eukprot:1436589-Rhodomonas_salina.3
MRRGSRSGMPGGVLLSLKSRGGRFARQRKTHRHMPLSHVQKERMLPYATQYTTHARDYVHMHAA